jgi:hypothetical protein
MDLRTTFAANVVCLRRAKGLSQNALACEEAGRHHVGLEIIGKLAEALEVEPAELLKMPSKRTRDRA